MENQSRAVFGERGKFPCYGFSEVNAIAEVNGEWSIEGKAA